MLVGSGLCLAAMILTVRETNLVDQTQYMLRQSEDSFAPYFECASDECPWTIASQRITGRIEGISRIGMSLPNHRPPPPPINEFDPFHEPPWHPHF